MSRRPTPFPAPPPQTGHEVLPHPAFPRAVDRAHSTPPRALTPDPSTIAATTTTTTTLTWWAGWLAESAIPAASWPTRRTPGWRPFARTGLCCPRRRHYYGLLRLPLDTPPLRTGAYRW